MRPERAALAGLLVALARGRDGVRLELEREPRASVTVKLAVVGDPGNPRWE